MPRHLRKMPAQLRPALTSSVRAHHVPVLPDWYPHDPGPDPKRPEAVQPEPYSDDQRRALREQRAVEEAITGPFDGRNVVVTFDPQDGPPSTFVPVSQPGVTYRLDRLHSTKHRLIYRYDMDCPLHHDMMRAVEDGFAEAGQAYAVAAREEGATHDTL